MSVSRSRAGLVRATAIGRRCTQQVSCTRSTVFRTYQSSSYSAPSPFNTAETAILSSALRYVPEHGFSDKSLARGAPDAGYREASTNLFPKGPFALVNYHLVTQRLGLRGNVQFRDDKLSAGAKVRALILGRLRGNESVIHRWQEVSTLPFIWNTVNPEL
jgi:ubiquinone biosynthesis protein COQ9